MRFLFVLNIGFDRNGPSVHLLQDIMQEGIRRGHEIVLIRRDTGGDLDLTYDSLNSSPLFTSIVLKSATIKKNNFISRYISEVKYAIQCKKQYKRLHGVDSVFLQSNTVSFFHTKYLKRILKCPILFNVQDVFPENLVAIGKMKPNGLIYRVMSSLQKKGYSSSTKVVTISADMLETLQKCGVHEEKLSYIYNWSYADSILDISKEQNSFSEMYLDKRKFHVIYAGNIGRMQNVDVVCKAAQVLKDKENIQFIIVGDGVYKDHLVEKYKELNNIAFVPFQKSSMAESVYCSADINIIPLAKGVINTALPSKTATCLRTQRNCIFCIGKESKFANELGDVNGVIVCDSDDYIGLSNAIVEMLSDPHEIRRDFVRSRMSFVNGPRSYVDILETLS